MCAFGVWMRIFTTRTVQRMFQMVVKGQSFAFASLRLIHCRRTLVFVVILKTNFAVRFVDSFECCGWTCGSFGLKIEITRTVQHTDFTILYSLCVSLHKRATLTHQRWYLLRSFLQHAAQPPVGTVGGPYHDETFYNVFVWTFILRTFFHASR